MENKKRRTPEGVGQVRDKKNAHGAGANHVRGEKRSQGKPLGNTLTPKEAYRAAKKSGVKPVKEERVNGAPVYTATYKVNRSDELLEFLLRKCNTSRNNVKALLARKQVLVNGSVVTQYNFPLAKDDEVKLSRRPMKEGAVAKMPTNARAGQVMRKKRPPVEFSVIYEDDDFIAVNKPVGLLSVESDKETECAYGYVLDMMQERDKNARPFILHRIDKETSGVLVFAKNLKIHSMMKMHWNEQVSTREYYAVVEGVPEKKEDTLISYLKENTNNMVYATKDPTGQKAITHYEVVKENTQYALLRVRIDTGRKNQIRVQMKEIGHGIIGDDKYGFTKNPLDRLGLHASKLEFIHPITKELISIKAGVPASFKGLFG